VVENAEPAEPDTVAGEIQLSGAQIQELIGGDTATGFTPNGATYRLKYYADGRLRFCLTLENFTDSGKWTVEGYQYCAQWETIREGKKVAGKCSIRLKAHTFLEAWAVGLTTSLLEKAHGNLKPRGNEGDKSTIIAEQRFGSSIPGSEHGGWVLRTHHCSSYHPICQPPVSPLATRRAGFTPPRIRPGRNGGVNPALRSNPRSRGLKFR
jgi:hypothetical protein